MTIHFRSDGDPEHRFLSNFWNVQIRYVRQIYPSAEHLYQALKTYDTRDREHIRLAATPLDAKRLGRTVLQQPDFDRVRAMKSVLALKFADPGLTVLLLNTEGEHLVENTHDPFWGGASGGENVLGQLLEEERWRITCIFEDAAEHASLH